MRLNSRALLVLTLAAVAAAQVTRREEVVVTGTAEPLPLEEADRAVTVLDAGCALLVNAPVDLLRLDASVDVAGRAPGGIQTDVSIRGGTFSQTLVLLNGMRLNDPQTGHHSLDLPVPLEAVERIEVLRGAGSTLYGSDAIGGAVNILTRRPEASEIRVRAAAGSAGIHEESLWVGTRGFALTAAQEFSSGFAPGRDYRGRSALASGWWRSALGATSVVAGGSDRPFGAAQFYGNFNSWERTKTWFASLEQELGGRTRVGFAFRRHSDLFVLERDRPELYTNRHVTELWQASVRRREPLAANTALHYGVEGYADEIASSSLGRRERGRAAGYALLDFRAVRRFSLSIGAREELYRRTAAELSPSLAGGAWLTEHWKLRASASAAFRVPTYTELYYRDPANIGSPELRPERARSYEAGAEWVRGRRMRASVTAFRRRETNGIDYVRRTTAEPWRAANLGRLEFTGAEAAVVIAPAESQRIEVSYSGLAGARAEMAGWLSKYVFNYPSQAGVVAWQGTLGRGFLARTRLGVVNRQARAPYAVWDASAAWTARRVRPFLQLTNLAGARYEEIVGVTMPGRTVVGGVEIRVR